MGGNPRNEVSPLWSDHPVLSGQYTRSWNNFNETSVPVKKNYCSLLSIRGTFLVVHRHLMEPAAKQFQLLYSGFSNPRDTVSLWAENGHVKQETACGPVSVIKVRATMSWRSGLSVTEKLTTVSHEVGAQDVQGLPLLTKPAARPSYASMAGKPSPSSHEPPNNGTRHLSHWLISGIVKGGGRVGVNAPSKG